jgi:hypothetical protein
MMEISFLWESRTNELLQDVRICRDASTNKWAHPLHEPIEPISWIEILLGAAPEFFRAWMVVVTIDIWLLLGQLATPNPHRAALVLALIIALFLPVVCFRARRSSRQYPVETCSSDRHQILVAHLRPLLFPDSTSTLLLSRHDPWVVLQSIRNALFFPHVFL